MYMDLHIIVQICRHLCKTKQENYARNWFRTLYTQDTSGSFVFTLNLTFNDAASNSTSLIDVPK